MANYCSRGCRVRRVSPGVGSAVGCGVSGAGSGFLCGGRIAGGGAGFNRYFLRRFY